MKACLAALKGCFVFLITISADSYAQGFIAEQRKAVRVVVGVR